MIHEVDGPHRWRRVVEELRRRRRRELVGVAVFAGAMYLWFLSILRPEARVAGLSGRWLLLAAAVLVVAAVVHHAVNWRCPACRRYLPGGLVVSFCPRCGALLKGDGGTVSADELSEAAVQVEVGKHRGDQILHLLEGLGVVIAGAVMTIFLDPIQVAPGGWWDQRFGERAPVVLQRALGGLVAGAGLLWIAHAVRGLTVGARRYAERLREKP